MWQAVRQFLRRVFTRIASAPSEPAGGEIVACSLHIHRNLVVVHSAGPARDTPEFQQKVRDWLDGKVSALILNGSEQIQVITVPVEVEPVYP